MKLLKNIAVIFFDIIDKIFHQKKILLYVKKNIPDLEIFFDIGSHNGSYTDLIKNNFKLIKIIMVEPQKKIFSFIKKKYHKNKNIIMYNFAISNKDSTKTLYINKHDLTTSLSKIDKKNSYLNFKARLFGGSINEMILSKVKMKTHRLDRIIKKNKLKKIDLLKIDTEGHELQVLKGTGSFLKKTKFILIEFHNSNIFLDYSADKIHNHLTNNNFKITKIFKFPFTTWEDRIYKNMKVKS